MDTRTIGHSNLYLGPAMLGLALNVGTTIRTLNDLNDIIDVSVQSGVFSFDVSSNYVDGLSEEWLGRSRLKEMARIDYVITTKVGWPSSHGLMNRQGLGRKHIVWSLEQSLIRLRQDYVDIVFAHRYFPGTDLIELVRTMSQIISGGKALYWAISEWPVDKIIEVLKVCDALNVERPILDQSIYSYAVRKNLENGKYEFLNEMGIGVVAYSPLCQGILTGKYRNKVPKNSRISEGDLLNYNKTRNFLDQYSQTINAFYALTDEYEYTPGHVAFQWLLKRNILPTFGARSISQLKENLYWITESINDEEFWSHAK